MDSGSPAGLSFYVGVLRGASEVWEAPEGTGKLESRKSFPLTSGHGVQGVLWPPEAASGPRKVPEHSMPFPQGSVHLQGFAQLRLPFRKALCAPPCRILTAALHRLQTGALVRPAGAESAAPRSVLSVTAPGVCRTESPVESAEVPPGASYRRTQARVKSVLLERPRAQNHFIKTPTAGFAAESGTQEIWGEARGWAFLTGLQAVLMLRVPASGLENH